MLLLECATEKKNMEHGIYMTELLNLQMSQSMADFTRRAVRQTMTQLRLCIMLAKSESSFAALWLD